MSDARIDQAKGDVKTMAGKVTGNEDLELEGRTESATAGVRKEAGDVMDQAADTARDVADRTRDAAGDLADKASDLARDAGDKVNDALKR